MFPLAIAIRTSPIHRSAIYRPSQQTVTKIIATIACKINTIIPLFIIQIPLSLIFLCISAIKQYMKFFHIISIYSTKIL